MNSKLAEYIWEGTSVQVVWVVSDDLTDKGIMKAEELLKVNID